MANTKPSKHKSEPTATSATKQYQQHALDIPASTNEPGSSNTEVIVVVICGFILLMLLLLAFAILARRLNHPKGAKHGNDIGVGGSNASERSFSATQETYGTFATVYPNTNPSADAKFGKKTNLGKKSVDKTTPFEPSAGSATSASGVSTSGMTRLASSTNPSTTGKSTKKTSSWWQGSSWFTKGQQNPDKGNAIKSSNDSASTKCSTKTTTTSSHAELNTTKAKGSSLIPLSFSFNGPGQSSNADNNSSMMYTVPDSKLEITGSSATSSNPVTSSNPSVVYEPLKK